MTTLVMKLDYFYKPLIDEKLDGKIPSGSSFWNQVLKKPEDRVRPVALSKIHPDDKKHPDLPGFVAPKATETHLAFHSEMCRELDALGDRWKYPQGR